MKVLYRVMGEKGRLNIPSSICKALDLKQEDLVAIRVLGDQDAILICKQHICDGCMSDKNIP